MTELAKFGSLRGKRVFITGGGTGIGETLVQAFCEQGALVAFVDIAHDASEALCERVGAAGHTAPLYRHCDITDIAALQGTIAELAGKLGDFDILVNNAANDHRHQTEEVTVEYYDSRIAINQRPMFFAVQSVLEGMKRKGSGSIINISSISFHTKSGGYPVYATTKSAVIGLTRGLARDLGQHGIRVNTVTPGWVMTQRQIDLWVDDAAEAEIKKAQCLPGKLRPEHIASMVMFLAADDSAMCTAQEFIVDAGWV
ncbi:SDR family NAD(P)-dependent oxidoreductase [Pseudoduganella namucuonensis]|uniref:NAD(P)-dependent dehydrogenase, short-chain alcohol dehydrogenase family n=1 Tax=Pseudoduganella namucuonensis TaxID=1035707 RepID=A0A1I7JEJ8_9BURK|nr:SDR family oxidoreductase [Pseudoduganella namucuonensis]SFU83583.1 NAD(P)-dependent dehydrogenase, short-chain alcohol dehydrogenase family [Pseudoduganella namucuonensis]